MTQSEKITTTRTLINDSEISADTISVYLNKAESAIRNRMYPFSMPTENFEVPSKYEMLQCELACRYISRRGAEGEETHNENGINRTYGSINDSDLLAEVMQVVL